MIQKRRHQAAFLLVDWINALPRKILGGLSAGEKVKLYLKEHAA